jgi:flagellar biosynthesis/type III secretory pathway chaperone
MQNTYIDIMLQSLKKKIQVLEAIKKLNILQKDLLEDEKADADEFDQTVEDKGKLIEQLEQLDSGFDKLFERVREELQEHKEDYKPQIADMQTAIRTITALSMELQAQEAKNKDLMTRRFVSVKQKAKIVRTNTKAASQYYQNMMQLNHVDPQFLDNKK